MLFSRVFVTTEPDFYSRLIIFWELIGKSWRAGQREEILNILFNSILVKSFPFLLRDSQCDVFLENKTIQYSGVYVCGINCHVKPQPQAKTLALQYLPDMLKMMALIDYLICNTSKNKGD